MILNLSAVLSELSQAAGREINRANVAAPDPNVHRNVAQAKKKIPTATLKT